MHRNILIICDIEGSSLCRNYNATRFLNPGWPRACHGMTLDVNAVVQALFDAGAQKILIKDFHRTGYNIFPSMIDQRACLTSGYRTGPVPGIGSPGDATGLIMLGMHAPSGSPGFLPHTLTSRISRLTVNNRLFSEAELFCAVLAPYNIAPLFFSGCPHACAHVEKHINGIETFPIDKTAFQNDTDIRGWRLELARRAAFSLTGKNRRAFNPKGPFHARITFREGRYAAQKIAAKWKFQREADTIILRNRTMERLFFDLIKTAYLNPMTLKMLPIGLKLYHLMGKTGLFWARRTLRRGSGGHYRFE